MKITHACPTTCTTFVLHSLLVCAIALPAEDSKSATANAAEQTESAEVGRWRPTTQRAENVGETTESNDAQKTQTAKVITADAEEAASEDEVSTDGKCKTASHSAPVDSSDGEVDVQEAEPDWITDRLFATSEPSWSWMIGGGNRFGSFSLESQPSMDLHFNTEDRFEITMASGIHFLQGPTQTDMPPRVYDFAANLQIQREIEPWMGVEANFNFGIHSDFEDSAREGVRFPGRALLYWDQSYDARWFAGVEYLDRDNIKILPAGGILWRPDEDIRLDLYFPRPKARIRIERTEKKEKWFYVEGEYHGNSWAIERVTGEADVVTYSDYRVSLGFETVPHDEDDSISFIEFSYLFDREIEYRSHVGDFDPGETVMIRAGHRH